MKIIYIAGPFRAPTQWDIAENIRTAEKAGLMVARAGAMPLIPHANTAHFHGQLHEDFWCAGTLELLKRADGAIFIPRWRSSGGALNEREECVYSKLPVLELDSLPPSADLQASIRAFIESIERNGEEDNTEEHGAVASSTADRVGQAAGVPAARHNKSSRGQATRAVPRHR